VDVCILKTTPLEVWLLNHADAAQNMNAGELFGFGLGTFVDKAVAAARIGQSKAIAWLMERDHSLLVHVADGTKKLRCFAQIAAYTAQRLGVTELSVTDHDVKVKLKDCMCLVLGGLS